MLLDISDRLRSLVADTVIVVAIAPHRGANVALQQRRIQGQTQTSMDGELGYTLHPLGQDLPHDQETGAPIALDSDAIGVDLDSTAATYLALQPQKHTVGNHGKATAKVPDVEKKRSISIVALIARFHAKKPAAKMTTDSDSLNGSVRLLAKATKACVAGEIDQILRRCSTKGRFERIGVGSTQARVCCLTPTCLGHGQDAAELGQLWHCSICSSSACKADQLQAQPGRQRRGSTAHAP